MYISAATRPLDCARDKICLRHYRIRTEHAYLDWIKRFLRFHGKRWFPQQRPHLAMIQLAAFGPSS
jgi:hypothetical protein